MLMLWTVRHVWPSGARFVFNCYKQWATLIVRDPASRTPRLLLSREGVRQGDPVSMVAFGLGLLPLIQQLKNELPEVIQPWYADDAAACGSFDSLERSFELLQTLGKPFGYYPQPAKCKLVVPHRLSSAAEPTFASTGFTVTTSARYLGGHLGDKDDRDLWLQEAIAPWTHAVLQLAEISIDSPQTAYAALTRSLKHHWQYIQRVTPDAHAAIEPIEEALRNAFLLSLLWGQRDEDPPYAGWRTPRPPRRHRHPGP